MKVTIGRVVIVKGRHPALAYGTDEQPAIVNKVWAMHGTDTNPVGINCTVLPDGGAPFCATSVILHHTRDLAAKAAADWVEEYGTDAPLMAFWPDRAS